MADRMFASEGGPGGGRPGTATRDVGRRNGGPRPPSAPPPADGLDAAVPVLRRLHERVERNVRLLDRLRSDPLLPEPAGLNDLVDTARHLRHDAASLLMLAGEGPGVRGGGVRTLAAVLDEAVDATAEPMRVDVRSGPSASVEPWAATELLHILAEVVDHVTSVHPSGRLEVTCRSEAPGGVVVEIRADGATRHDPEEWQGRGLAAAARLAQRSRSGIVLHTPTPLGGPVSNGPLASVHCPGTVVTVDESLYGPPLGASSTAAGGAYGETLHANGGRVAGSLDGGLGGLGDRPFSRILDEYGASPPRLPAHPEAEALGTAGRPMPELPLPARRPDPLSDPLPDLPPAGSGWGDAGPRADLAGSGAPSAHPAGPGDLSARRRTAWDSYASGARDIADPAPPPPARTPRDRRPPVRIPGAQVPGAQVPTAQIPTAQIPTAPQRRDEPVDELFGPIVDLGPLSDEPVNTPIFEAVASAWFREDADAGREPRRNGHSPADPLDWESPSDTEWRAAAERAAAEHTPEEEYPLTSNGLPRRRPGGRLLPPRVTEDAAPPVDRVPDRVRERLSGYQRGLRQGRHRAEPGQPADPGDPAAW